LAWDDEFDEPEGDGEASIENHERVLPEEEEEEEEEEFNWGEAEGRLAPFRLRKPQVEQASGGEPSTGGSTIAPLVKDGTKELRMVSGLPVKGKSTFWDAKPGELPEVHEGGRTRSG